MNKNKTEADCTRGCKSRRHGQILTSAITKRSVSDEALASFIKATCANFNKAFDFEGRTALHMSASRGRNRLMEWLVRHSSEAFINARDRESGYTPLHRSIFYGQITSAVNLIKMGVNTDIKDKDDYKALEHAMLDRQHMYTHEGVSPSEAYVWGSNSNYTLGTGNQQQKNTPDLMSSFSRNNTWVKQVCLGKFHSVWICSGTSDGEVWCCGQISRAGGPHSTALRPLLLRLPEPCLQAAVTLNSTVFLLESGTFIQYTLNTADNTSQSGAKVPNFIKLPSTKAVLKLSQPLGVCSGRAHVVAWNVRAIYSWGVNMGQLGHPIEEKIVTAPKRLALSISASQFQLVSASDAATVVTTAKGDVYLLHKYICKKIAVKLINLRQVTVDAKVTDQGVYSGVTVLLLNNVGQLLLWQDSTNKLTRCVFGLAHQTIITNVALTSKAFYFTTKHGEAFVGRFARKTRTLSVLTTKDEKNSDEDDIGKQALVKFLEKEDCSSVDICKIPNVHRAVSISVDSEGLNFACLQIKPTCGLKSLPELSVSSMYKHMGTLLETAAEDDLLYDVMFKVGGKSFPAHIFIVASSSEYLYKLYQEQIQKNPLDKPVINLDNIHPDIFERIMRFIYTGNCDVANLGPCSLKIRREDLPLLKKDKEMSDMDTDILENVAEISAFEVYKQSNKGKRNNSRNVDSPAKSLYCDPVKLLQASAKRVQVMALHKLLDKFYYRNGTVYLKDAASHTKNPPQCWDRNSYPELVDTNVCSKDGILIPAHKCVLAARLEYFQGMFMHSWTESKVLSKVNLAINHGILEPVINFLYTDTCPEIESTSSMDFICSMLIVADQLFITHLREMCEVALANLITLKNCAELCQFAHTYNATQLKQCCMEFISLNLANVLENKILDVVEEALIDDITAYYCKYNPILSSRIITPFFNSPSDEMIEGCAMNYPVNLDYTDEDIKMEVEVAKKRQRSSKKVEYTDNEKARMRYESVSSVTSLDLSNEITGDITLSLSSISKEIEKGTKEKQEKWIEVPSTQQKQQKVVQARLKAASTARDILNEQLPEQFTKLTRNSSSFSRENGLLSSSRMSVSPKESPIAEISKNLQGNLVINHIGPKLSQKQRKKLALTGESTSPHNLDNYFTDKLNIGSPPDKPKNPWKICEPPPASSSQSKTKIIEFNQILTDEKKQRENSSRIMTKPLIMTQLEDKAIEELERFYNIHEIDDELITVKRIELKVSSPQWTHTATNIL